MMRFGRPAVQRRAAAPQPRERLSRYGDVPISRVARFPGYRPETRAASRATAASSRPGPGLGSPCYRGGRAGSRCGGNDCFERHLRKTSPASDNVGSAVRVRDKRYRLLAGTIQSYVNSGIFYNGTGGAIIPVAGGVTNPQGLQ